MAAVRPAARLARCPEPAAARSAVGEPARSKQQRALLSRPVTQSSESGGDFERLRVVAWGRIRLSGVAEGRRVRPMLVKLGMGPLSGRAALVTGAGMGIGQAIAVELAHQGADVAVHYAHSAPDETLSRISAIGRLGTAVQ